MFVAYSSVDICKVDKGCALPITGTTVWKKTDSDI